MAWRQKAEAAEADWAAAMRLCAGLICRPMPADEADMLLRAFALAEQLRVRVQKALQQPSDGTAGAKPLPDPIYTHRLHEVLRLADRIGPVLRAVIGDPPQPLYPPPRLGYAAETGAASDRLLWLLHGVINPAMTDASTAASDAHPDIPLKMSLFLQHIHAARRIALAQGKPEARFLDLGCGAGMKVLAAADAFGAADGLDFDPGYIAAARMVLTRAGNRHSRILLADGLTFDGYGDYDIIYLFQPMTEDGRLSELERFMVGQARTGTLIVAPYPWFGYHHADYGCVHIAGAVYGVGIPDPAALRTRAEAMGLAMRQPLTAQDYRRGALMPVITALRAVGYDLR